MSSPSTLSRLPGLALLPILLLAACGRGGGEEGEASSSGEGPATQAEPPTSETPAHAWNGCYLLRPLEEGWRMPDLVALSVEPLQGWPAFSERFDGRVFGAHAFTESGRPTDVPFAYWRPRDRDGVVVGHPGALAGVTLEFWREEGEVRGRALAFTDVISPDGETGRDSTLLEVQATACPGDAP